MQDGEQQVLTELLARIEIAEEIHSLVQSWMTQAPEESDELWETLSADPETAKTALYQIVNMAAADKIFQFSELLMMDRFREKLGVSQQDYQEIVNTIEKLVAR